MSERRRTYLQLLALLGLALAVLWTHRRLVLHGVCFGDSAWSFHFGHRVSDGATPYSDFVYPFGPLPLYVEAAFQRSLGPEYMASLAAAALVKFVRVVVVWRLATRLAGGLAGLALAAASVFSPVFGGLRHESICYVELGVLVAAWLIVAGSSQQGPRATTRLGLAGCILSFTSVARPDVALLIIVVSALASCIALPRPQRLALLAGIVVGIALIVATLGAVGTLGDFVQQAVLDPFDRRNVHSFSAAVDAVFGGTLTDPSLPLSFVMTFLFLPAVIVGTTLYLVSRPTTQEISVATIALMIAPTATVILLVNRYHVVEYFSDLPRTFLTVLVILAIGFPGRLRRWFGLEPAVVVALGALPLAADWAVGIETRGRNGGDLPALVIAVLLLACASKRLHECAKTWTCGVLAVAALAHFVAEQRSSHLPYGSVRQVEAVRGKCRTPASHPALAGLRITKGRELAINALRERVPARSTCFIHGDLPVLYTLLECRNPTRVDSISAGFATSADGAEALRTLRSRPPDFILVQAQVPRTELGISAGMPGLLDQYELIDAVDPTSFLQPTCDGLDTVHLYRLRNGT